MSKLPITVTKYDFKTYILPNLSHKLGYNRQKMIYHYVFSIILYILSSKLSKFMGKVVCFEYYYFLLEKI